MPIDPAVLSGKHLWLRGKDLGAVGSTVTSWTDQSGGSNNATVTSGTPKVDANVPIAAATDNGHYGPVGGDGAAAYAIDGANNTYWTTNGVASGWMRMQLGVATVVAEYKIRRRDDIPNRNPKDWTFQGSNDGTNFTTLDTRTNVTWGTSGETKTFTFSNSTAYLYYRLNVTANNGDTYLSVTEISLTGTDKGLYTSGSVIDLVADTAGGSTRELWVIASSGQPNGGAGERAWDLGSSTQPTVYPYTDGKVYDGAYTNTRQNFSWTLTPINTKRIYRVTMTGGAWKAYLDGVEQYSGTGLTFGLATAPKLTNGWTNGTIYEVFERTVISSSGEVADLITYFNTEHGMTVAGGSSGNLTTSDLPVAVALSAAARVSVRTTSDLPIAVSLPATGRTAGSTTSSLPIGVAAPSVARSVLRTTSDLPINVAMPTVIGSEDVPLAIDMTGTGSMSVAFTSTPLNIDMSATGSFTIDDLLATQTLEIDMSGGMASDAVIPRVRVTDPSTGRSPYRLVVVDMQGTRIAELDKVRIEPITDELNGMGGFEFTMSSDDPKTAECLVPQREIQVWRGRDLLGWCVLVRARGDDKTVTFSALGLEWYFTRRVMGKAPLPNLLRNGSFEQGETYWNFGYVTGSIPAKPPVHGITSVTLNGTKALQISGAAGSQSSRQVLQGDVAFAFDSSTLTSAGIAEIDALMATIVTDNPDIRCEGHADSTGSSSYNYTLSVNRAESVRDRILVTKPGANVTVVGYGETRPRATNSTSAGRALNRRVEIEFSELLKAKGHRQYAGQSFTISNPSSSKKAKALTLVGWCQITAYTDPSKDGYGVYMQMVDVLTNKVIKTTNVPIDEFTPRGKWIRMECSFDLPANGRTYRIDVRLYPPEGTCIWDEIGVTAAEQLAFFDTDETLIAKGLVEHAQDPAMGKTDLNIGFEGKLSGIKRTREYPWIERMQIEEALSEFPTLADGLDLSMDLTATTRKVHSWYPRKGRNRGYVLALGSNISTFSMDYDGQQTATRVIVQAEGEGSDREEGVATDTTKMNGTVLETVYNATPGSAISSLQKQAERGIARYSRPMVIPQVVMHPRFTDEILDRVTTGDVCRTIIKKGWVNIDALYRVTSVTLDPATDSVVLALAVEDVSV